MNGKLLIRALFLLSALLSHSGAGAAAPPSAEFQPQSHAGWVKSSGNPFLGGNLGTCFDVAVLKEGDTFRMWFSWRPKSSIALVESRDGLHWSTPPLIVLAPNKSSGWEENINRPTVLKRGGVYHMWYTGQAKGHSWIGYATSPDGRQWRRMNAKPVLSPTVPWEKVAVMNPSVLWDEAGHCYRMWYSGGENYEPNAIGYATSPDGLHWTKSGANPVFGPDPAHPWEQNRVAGCQMLPYRQGFLMFYIGYRDIDHAQIGVARSASGLSHWVRHPANPIVRPGQGEWDEDACYKPFAILDGRRWLLWYNGRRQSFEQIGLVIHEGEDLGF